MRVLSLIILSFVLSFPAAARSEDGALGQLVLSAGDFTAEALPSPKPVPARKYVYDAVMLQGFHWFADSYWYNPPKGWWGVLGSMSGDIARSGFDMVWFPPAAVGSYYPTEWYNLDSQWGKGEELVRAVNAMHYYGILVLGDIVLNHRNGKTDWADFKNPDWPTTVIVRDDEWTGSPKSSNYDQGQGDPGCRDLDHSNPIVQEDTKKYLAWLRSSIGYDGWRYDMVKGYPAYYAGLYNQFSKPVFSVGEYYDGDREKVAGWIKGTDYAANGLSASDAFDFTTRYNIVGAVETGNYALLAYENRPSGLIGIIPAKAVTFVDNHDTVPREQYFMANAPKYYRDGRTVAYAYILTHPGIPCVFWPHFYDWGPEYKNRIAALIALRKKTGVNAVSRVEILAAKQNLYAAVITGANGKLLVKLGTEDFSAGNGWTLAESGTNYAVWTSASVVK